MNTLYHDFRYALRQLARNPGFAAATVLTLALGIGANTAIFTLVNRVFLKPLPFPAAERLTLLWGDNPRSGWDQLPVSFPNYTDIRAQSTRFEEIGAWSSSRDRRMGLSGGDAPEEIQYAAGSASLFRALRVEPDLGRTFLDEEDQPGGEPVVLISHGLWQRRFGGAAQVLGRSLTLDGEAYQVVGVLPSDFKFVSYPRSPDVWLPLQADPATGRGNRSARYARGASYLGVLARLKNGVTLDQARTEVARIAGGLAERYPDFNTGWSVRLVPLHDQIIGPLRTAVLLLTGAVGLVLLIACANVAGLLLARGTARERELSIRAAMGASRRRLVTQLLTESMLLGLLGGGAGIALAVGMISLPAFSTFSHPDLFVPYHLAADPLSIDLRVLAFTLGISLLTGTLFGLVPALRSSRLDLQQALKGSHDTGSGPRPWGRQLLVLSQVALSLVLLIGAGLLGRSLLRLEGVDPGFLPDHVLAVDLTLNRTKYADPDRAAGFYQQLTERLAKVPGVRAAAAVEQMPLSGQIATTDFRIEGRPEPPVNQKPETQYGSVTPDYFRALGIRLIGGRTFLPTDDQRAAGVAIVNQAMVRRYWPGENPVGKRLGLSVEALVFGPDGPPRIDFQAASREIVGVVADVRGSGLAEEPEPEVYLPSAQRPARDMTVTLATTGDAPMLGETVRRTVSELDPDQPLSAIRSLDGMVSQSLGEPRFRTFLLVGFATAALSLAAVGLYGMVAYAVSRRRREIGIRIALGARPSAVLRLMLTDGLRPVLAGILIGAVAALAASRLLSGLLYGVTTTDPVSFVVVPIFLALIAALACYLPARRVLRIDPVEALRSE